MYFFGVVNLNTCFLSLFGHWFWSTTGDSLDVAISPHPVPEEPQLSFYSSKSAWKEWSSWSACSVTCGSGNRVRTRVCKDERQECFGRSSEQRTCGMAPCPYGECQSLQHLVLKSEHTMSYTVSLTNMIYTCVYQCMVFIHPCFNFV